MRFPSLPNALNEWLRGAAVGAAVVGAVWLARPSLKQEVRLVEKRIVETKVEWRDRVVVQTEDKVRTVRRTKKEVKPDGTKTETQTVVTEEGRRDSVERDTRTSVGQRNETSRESTRAGVAPLRRYHLHIGYAPVFRSGLTVGKWEAGGFSRQQFLVGVGVRLGHLPASAVATAVWPFSNSFLPMTYIGLQVEL